MNSAHPGLISLSIQWCFVACVACCLGSVYGSRGWLICSPRHTDEIYTGVDSGRGQYVRLHFSYWKSGGKMEIWQYLTDKMTKILCGKEELWQHKSWLTDDLITDWILNHSGSYIWPKQNGIVWHDGMQIFVVQMTLYTHRQLKIIQTNDDTVQSHNCILMG